MEQLTLGIDVACRAAHQASLARLDTYLELLGPAWHAAFGGDLANNTPLRFLAAGYADPYVVRRLGRARLSRFIWRYSHGHWGEELAERLLGAAAETLALWDGEMDYTELAADIAAEARLALALTTEIRDLEQKTAALLHHHDPACGDDFYARGHIRAIAKVVGVDPAPLIREFDRTRQTPDKS